MGQSNTATRLQRASAPADERCTSKYLPELCPQSLLLKSQTGNLELFAMATSLDTPCPLGSIPPDSGRRVHAFAADSSRRSFAARAVSRNSGSESFRHRS